MATKTKPEDIEKAIAGLRGLLQKGLPEGRNQNVALKQLESVEMWAVRGLKEAAKEGAQ